MSRKAKSNETAPKSKSAAEKTPAGAKVAQSGMIRARIAPELKAEAESILNQIGLSSATRSACSTDRSPCTEGCRSRLASPTRPHARPCSMPRPAET